MTPNEWKDLVDILLIPISWIAGPQRELLLFLTHSSSLGMAVLKYLVVFFPVLLFLGALWCTQLSVYTLPFRSRRLEFIVALLIAWWDAVRAVGLFWVGLVRVVIVALGWVFSLGRLAVKLLIETLRQIVMAPFSMTGRMTRSYFQPGVPWVAFLMLIFWCLLESTIFTYTLFPTISEVLADLVGVEPSPLMGTVLFLFLLMLIMGSFACIQALMDAFKKRDYRFVIQMVAVELFVMFFEVMFLYRELVDAITPWIAQHTDEQFRLGIGFTLSVAIFGWIGIRGMTWFLFGQYGTTPLLAFISRQPLTPQSETSSQETGLKPSNWWTAPVQEFKQEISWLHEKSQEVLEYLTLPVLQVFAALLNFAMILVTAQPVFNLPFRSLREVMETKELLAKHELKLRKVES